MNETGSANYNSAETVQGRTPAPWEISPAKSGDGETLIVGGEGREFGLIAAVTYEADARLIAAAPDLLNALKAAMAVLITADDDKIPRLAERIRLAEQAILKAEGRA